MAGPEYELELSSMPSPEYKLELGLWTEPELEIGLELVDVVEVVVEVVIVKFSCGKSLTASDEILDDP